MAAIRVEVERRPCYVGEKRAFFNCWSQESHIVEPSIAIGGHQGGVVAGVLGIVEFVDGTVARVRPEEIQFADGGGFDDHRFYLKNWLKERARNDEAIMRGEGK